MMMSESRRSLTEIPLCGSVNKMKLKAPMPLAWHAYPPLETKGGNPKGGLWSFSARGSKMKSIIK
jgi:hypothetical protein